MPLSPQPQTQPKPHFRLLNSRRLLNAPPQSLLPAPPRMRPPPPLFSFPTSSTTSFAIAPPKGSYNVVTEGNPVVEEVESGSLPPGLQKELMPNHVAVIMDGNRRWARKRGLPVGSGYEAGIRSLRGVMELCCRWGIRVLTVFAFSSDNWFRPEVEINFLMRLFERVLKDQLEEFEREGIQISSIGDSSKLPKSLEALLVHAIETTKNNSRLHLIVGVNYSGQHDVVQACKNIALKAKDGLIEPEDINELLIEQELQTNCTDFPCPDLLIRTSGELRISNFLLWQLAYTELYFARSLWPDFGEDEFLEALHSFQKRQRRYGRQSS